MKREALRVERFLVLEGGTKTEAAQALRVSRRTLLNWERHGGGPLPLRGRPRLEPDEATRAAIMKRLEEVGPHLGVEPLKALFPAVSRRSIAAIVSAYRQSYAREHALSELKWRLPGAVWAMDHTEAPDRSPIIAVRDLGSGQVLEWLGSHPLSEEVIEVLERLMCEAGAPLVLKSDMGSAFTAHTTREFLNSRGITHLLSPPRYPAYNGAIESTVGWMKRRTLHQARLLGSALEWSPETLEPAKEIANAHVSSRGREAPDAVWKARPVIPDAFRKAFTESVVVFEEALLEEAGLDPSGDPDPGHAAERRRKAIERALVAHGILHVTRRRIPLRICSRPWEKIG